MPSIGISDGDRCEGENALYQLRYPITGLKLRMQRSRKISCIMIDELRQLVLLDAITDV